MKALSITKDQIKHLHTLYRNVGLDEYAKREMLLFFTKGRTNSTKALSHEEAKELAESLNERCQTRDSGKSILRTRRSGALKRMQQIGVDTTDWTKVNGFCEDKRIARKQFYYLTEGELSDLIEKLEKIKIKPNGKG